MKSPFICSYVIAYNHSPQNLKILKENLNVLMKDPRIQIIIVESGAHNSHLKNLDMRSKIVFLESDTWNLGWMYNIAMKHTSTDLIFFSENRFHPRIEVIQTVVQNHGDRNCIYPQDSLATLTKEQTHNRTPNMDVATTTPTNKGIIFYTRDGLRMCGGFDENVVGQDFWDLTEKRNQTTLNIGKINGNALVVFYTDDYPVKEELVEYSKKHRDKIVGLDPTKMLNYMKAQYKKSGNVFKYKKDVLMEP